MQNKLTELLVSVRNLTEAQIAFDSGVDIIDIKEPDHGSLGAAPWEVICDIASAFPQTPISAALGEIDECEKALCNNNATQKFERGLLTYAKCGLANSTGAHSEAGDWKDRTRLVWSKISEFASPVSVAYADPENAKCPSPFEILDLAINCNVNVLLVDTFLKDGRSSLDHLSIDEVTQLFETAQCHGVKTVLAGSISKSVLLQITDMNIDCIAVRGAVCDGSRTAKLSAELLRDFQCSMQPLDKNSDIEFA